MTKVKTTGGVSTRVGGGVTVKGRNPSSIKVSEDGAFKGTQPEINFTGDVTVTNDPANNRVNVNVTASTSSTPAPASLLGNYNIDTSGIVPPVGNGDIRYNNATQISSTNLYVSHLTNNNTDIEIILLLLTTGNVIIIQDRNESDNYQIWSISGAPSFSTPTLTIPVTLSSSGGTGTTGFANNHEVFLAAYGGSGGGGTPGGSDTQVQFNDSGAFGGDADWTYNKTTNIQTIKGGVIVSDETASRIAHFDANKQVKALGTATYPSLTELSYIKGLRAMPSRTLAYKNTSPVSLTGVAVATIIRSVLIPANTFQAGDMVYFETIFRKGVTTGTYSNGFIYANTSSSLVGVTGVAQLTTMGTTDRWLKHVRTMFVESSNSSYIFASGTGIASDILLSSGNPTNLTIDWSIDQYLILAYTPGNSGDTLTNELFLVEIVR